MIDDDVVITAKFKLKHNITINCDPAGEGCQATANPSKTIAGTSVTLTATVAGDYEFVE